MQKNEVTVMRYYNKCKCCLEEGQLKDLWAEYIDHGGTVVYGDMISECFVLPWQIPSDVMELICENCIIRLRDAFQFRKEILSSQKVWNELEQQESKLNTENEDVKHVIEIVQPKQKSVKSEKDENEEGSNQKETFTYYIQETSENDTQDEDNGYDISFLNEQSNQGGRQEGMQGDTDGESSGMQVEYLEDDIEADRTQLTRKTVNKRKNSRKMKVYKQYTQADLMCAIKMVTDQVMTRSEASQKYNIPVKTLGAKLRSIEMEDKGGDGTPNSSDRPQKSITLNVKQYDNIRSVLLYSNATPIKGHWGIGYGCCFCPKQFSIARDLKTHTLESHKDSEKTQFMKGKPSYGFVVKLDTTHLKCNLCLKAMETLEKLMTHLKENHDKKIHTDIPNQIVPFKLDGEILKCGICHIQFDFFKLLNEHMNYHYRNFECKYCDRVFINKTSLRIHGYRHRIGEFHCKYCTKVFTTKTKKTRHERMVHKLGSKAYKCGYCDEKFMDTGAKYKHENLVHGADLRTFECHACDAVFHRPWNLKQHTRTVHLLYKPFKCSVCDKSFINKTILRKHMDKHSR